jgi:small conductance mechanosensitive channel
VRLQAGGLAGQAEGVVSSLGLLYTTLARASDVQALLREAIHVPLRGAPHIALEQVDGEHVVVRIEATPEHARDGAPLADQILAAVTTVAGERAVFG